MKIKIRKNEIYPVFYEVGDSKRWEITGEIEVDTRTWIDYKMARDKFMKKREKLFDKMEEVE